MTAGKLNGLELLDLVEVLGQARRKRRKRVRMRIELVGRLGGMDHGTDTGIGQQLQQQRMWRRAVDDVGTEDASGKGIDGSALYRPSTSVKKIALCA